MTISAKIICDNEANGVRLTTMVLRYPRFIHSEFMTHRMFSRNASSSRAIPVAKTIQDIIDDPAMPVHWGKNQKGMQADEEVTEEQAAKAKEEWLAARDLCIHRCRSLVELGIHKQIANRILEPWHHITVVCTATEWSNFFALRCHPAAQPEMRCLGEAMREAYNVSDPRQLEPQQYHLPFINEDEFLLVESYEDLCHWSIARCARVSYLNHDGSKPDIVKDAALHDRLLADGHMSPFEHVATPGDPNKFYGNFKGWKQYRKQLPGENR